MDYFCVHSAVSMEFSPIFLVHNDFCRSMSYRFLSFYVRAVATILDASERAEIVQSGRNVSAGGRHAGKGGKRRGGR